MDKLINALIYSKIMDKLINAPIWLKALKLPESRFIPYYRETRKLLNQLDKHFYVIIGKTRDEILTQLKNDLEPREAKDILSLILQDVLQQPGPTTYSLQDIRDDRFSMFFPGHETVATTISVIFYHFAKNPAIQKLIRSKLYACFTDMSETRESLKRVFEEYFQTNPTVSKLETDLPAELFAFIYEAMRYQPASTTGI